MNCATKLAAQVFLAALLLAAAAPAAHATDYHWIGAGTGGNNATDPLDLTTQWNNPANWQENKVPGATENAYVSLTGAGYANVQSGSVGGLNMSGSSLGGALHIGAGVDFTVVAPGWGVFPGYSGQGRIVQTGGSFTSKGLLRVGWNGTGNYLLQDGTLNVAKDEAIGYSGSGTFTQTGGTHTVGGELSVGGNGTGVLNVGAGVLTASSLAVYGSGAVNITSPNPLIRAEQVHLYGNSTITAVPGSSIHIVSHNNPEFYTFSQNEKSLAGLENLAIVFDGDTEGWIAGYEVAGADLGATAAGFQDNFAIGSLFLGDANPAWVGLVDRFDNGNRSSAEALYVHNLTIGPGSKLDLGSLKLYYDGTLVNQGTIIGGNPIYVPEPATLWFLGLGFLMLTRRSPMTTVLRSLKAN